MNPAGIVRALAVALREVRLARLLALLLGAMALAFASDWLRSDRVIFPAPLPTFTTVPATP